MNIQGFGGLCFVFFFFLPKWLQMKIYQKPFVFTRILYNPFAIWEIKYFLTSLIIISLALKAIKQNHLDNWKQLSNQLFEELFVA